MVVPVAFSHPTSRQLRRRTSVQAVQSMLVMPARAASLKRRTEHIHQQQEVAAPSAAGVSRVYRRAVRTPQAAKRCESDRAEAAALSGATSTVWAGCSNVTDGKLVPSSPPPARQKKARARRTGQKGCCPTNRNACSSRVVCRGSLRRRLFRRGPALRRRGGDRFTTLVSLRGVCRGRIQLPRVSPSCCCLRWCCQGLPSRHYASFGFTSGQRG